MKLGYASPARMLAEMTPSDLGRWIALHALDPWDESRADLRTGIVAAVIANVNRGKGSHAYSPADFMPQYRPKKETSVKDKLFAFLKGRPTKRKD